LIRHATPPFSDLFFSSWDSRRSAQFGRSRPIDLARPLLILMRSVDHVASFFRRTDLPYVRSRERTLIPSVHDRLNWPRRERMPQIAEHAHSFFSRSLPTCFPPFLPLFSYTLLSSARVASKNDPRTDSSHHRQHRHQCDWLYSSLSACFTAPLQRHPHRQATWRSRSSRRRAQGEAEELGFSSKGQSGSKILLHPALLKIHARPPAMLLRYSPWC
jgi:hypothetical protein